MLIRDPRPDDEANWRELWLGYTRFYQTDVPDAVTAATWGRVLDPKSAMFARVAEKDAILVGFCICVLHDGTWSQEPVCYLEDLFVAPDARKAGVGRALIEDVLALGRKQNWARVYWHTQADNATARKLYDAFTPADAFVRYRVSLPHVAEQR
jgi:GNAT superfamily N-acetyltransferase